MSYNVSSKNVNFLLKFSAFTFTKGSASAAAAVSSRVFHAEELMGGSFNLAFLLLVGRVLLGLVILWAKTFGVRSLSCGVIT